MKLDGRLIINDMSTILGKRGLEPGGRVQQVIDSEVLRLCEPYVPRRTGDLIRSGISHTSIGSGLVVYNTPYARRWYYEAAKFSGAPKRGNYWFERMKNEGGAEKILRAAAAISGGDART